MTPEDVAARLMGILSEREIRFLAEAVFWRQATEDHTPDFADITRDTASSAGHEISEEDVGRVLEQLKRLGLKDSIEGRTLARGQLGFPFTGGLGS